MKYKIGEQVIFDKDIVLESIMGKKTVYKKGTKAIVCSNKWLRLPDGTFWSDWFGKDNVVNGYATENIAREVANHLRKYFNLDEMLDDYEESVEKFIDEIDIALDDIL